MEHPKLGKYRHSKSGNEYKVLGVVRHSETLEEMVLYEALYDNEMGKMWVRPIGMFMEKVNIGGRMTPRFEYIEDGD